MEKRANRHPVIIALVAALGFTTACGSESTPAIASGIGGVSGTGGAGVGGNPEGIGGSPAGVGGSGMGGSGMGGDSGAGGDSTGSGQAGTGGNTPTLAVQFADTVIRRWPDPRNIADRTRGWDYNNGIVLRGMSEVYEKTRDPRYLAYIKQYVDSFVDG